MIRHPKCFAGGLVTDIGPVSFADSDLYKYVDDSVMETNMDLPWPEMKADLQKRITERNLRSLIQTQIYYPEKQPPAQWRLGMQNFREMLQAQSADDQLEQLKTVDAVIAENGAKLRILKAERLSAITPQALTLMKDLRCLEVLPVSDCTHFLHISHRDTVVQKLLEIVH
jgi:hypothetical protein